MCHYCFYVSVFLKKQKWNKSLLWNPCLPNLEKGGYMNKWDKCFHFQTSLWCLEKKVHHRQINIYLFFFFFIYLFYLDFLSHNIHDLQDSRGRGRPFFVPLYHFHPLHKHWHVSWTITTENSPLHIANGRTRTGNLWFPIVNREPLSYSP